MDEPTCSIDGCERPVKARSLCATDWDRWRQALKSAGLPLPPLEPKPLITCSADDCDEPAGRRSGLCRHHYLVKRRHGDPNAPDGRKSRTQPPEVRFWAKVNKNGPVPEHKPELGPCWVWTSAKFGSGYGNFYPGGGRGTPHVGAHRFAYETEVGPIPEGMDLDHLCHPGDGSCAEGTACPHRLCVNPRHHEPASRLQNLERGNTFVAVNLAATHCPAGHEYTPENTRIRIGRSGNENRSCKTCRRRPLRSRSGSARPSPAIVIA